MTTLLAAVESLPRKRMGDGLSYVKLSDVRALVEQYLPTPLVDRVLNLAEQNAAMAAKLEEQGTAIRRLEYRLAALKSRKPVGYLFRVKGDEAWQLTESVRVLRKAGRVYGSALQSKTIYGK